MNQTVLTPHGVARMLREVSETYKPDAAKKWIEDISSDLTDYMMEAAIEQDERGGTKKRFASFVMDLIDKLEEGIDR